MTNGSFLIFVVAMTLVLSGCESVNCSDSNSLVADEKSAAEIVQWADRIFKSDWSTLKLSGGNFVGPGISSVFIDDSELPQDLRGREIRVVSDKLGRPIGLFVASRSYRGILVSRSEGISHLLKLEHIPSGEVLAIGPRLAAICRPRR